MLFAKQQCQHCDLPSTEKNTIIINHLLITKWHVLKIVCIGVSTPLPPPTPPPLFLEATLKSANCPIPPIFCFFVKPSPPKNGIFQWAPIIFKCLSLTPSHLLKVTKFLVRFSQFKFLVMTKKNIFVYKLFLYLNISDFSLLFMWRMQTPKRKKATPCFPATPL